LANPFLSPGVLGEGLGFGLAQLGLRRFGLRFQGKEIITLEIKEGSLGVKRFYSPNPNLGIGWKGLFTG